MSSPFPSPEVRRLAAELARLQTQVSELQVGLSTASAGRSSLDGGTWVIKDGDGIVRQIVGQQTDGAFTNVDLNGGVPATPVAPVVTAVPGGFKVAYSGAFELGVARPTDLALIEVHVDLDPLFDIADSTRDAALLGRGSVTFATDDYVPHTVRLVAVNTSGVRSEPSDSVTVTPLQLGPGDIAPNGVGSVNLDDGAVTPPKSSTGVTSNLVPDPGFNNAGWRAKRALAPWGFVEAPSVGFTTGDWAAFCGPTTTRAALSATGPGGIPVIPGEVYYIAYDAARSGAGAGEFFLEVTFWDSTGTLTPATTEEGVDPLLDEVRSISSLPTSTFEVRHGQVTIPPLVSLMRVAMIRQDQVGTSAGNLFLDRLEVRPVITQANSGSRVETSPSGVLVFGEGGAPVGSINADGSLSMVTGQFDQSLTYGGTEMSEWLAQRARGEVARSADLFTSSPATTTEVEWLFLEFTAEAGRSYKLRSSGLIAKNSGRHGLQVRWTTNGNNPLLTSTVLTYNDTPQNGTFALNTDLGDVSGQIKFLFTVRSWDNTSSIYWDPADIGSGFNVWVEDVGPRTSASGAVVTPAGTPIGGGGTAPTPTPTIKEFVTIFPSTWSQAWIVGNTTRATNAGGMWQGYYSGASMYGDQVGIFGFDYAAISSALSGATITKFEVYLYAEHWYYGAGGTVRLGTTPAGTPPGSFPTVTAPRATWHLNKPEGRWVTLNAGVTIGNEFKSGASRSLALEPRPYSRELEFYGRFSGATTAAGRNPAIRITYTKAV